jgi:hypothetical protein
MPFTNLAAQASTTLQAMSDRVRKAPSPTIHSVSFLTGQLTPASEMPAAMHSTIAAIDAWRLKGHRFVYFLEADAAGALVSTPLS